MRVREGIEDDPWVSKDELRSIISQAVTFTNSQNIRGSSCHTTLLEILSEKIPLGSQVIADESDIIKKLPKQLRENFMVDFTSRNTNKLSRALLHDGRWKESNEKLAEITDGILEMLPEEAEVLNEETYLTNLIVPAI
ncbi:hypothetical protein C1645_813534 [Glomus cerebriforme]|uniref:Uncharacterized protein n=1 Tax=Glomus cerebriforme TaxID=658196 RepID=A0A397TRX8_9GLOM|nr:hypothetical protein C1645_813534 [Glomus cerebriforme]